MNQAAEPRGLRERKKLKARRELERVALDLFQRKGFEQTTIREIADAADMSPRTFFRYFSSKEEVIFARSTDDIEALQVRLRARPEEESPYESVRQALMDWSDRLQDSKEDITARVRVAAGAGALRRRGAQLREEIARAVVQELGGRAPQSDRSRNALVASVCVLAMSLAIVEWSAAELEKPLRSFVHDCFERLENEIRSANPL